MFCRVLDSELDADLRAEQEKAVIFVDEKDTCSGYSLYLSSSTEQYLILDKSRGKLKAGVFILGKGRTSTSRASMSERRKDRLGREVSRVALVAQKRPATLDYEATQEMLHFWRSKGNRQYGGGSRGHPGHHFLLLEFLRFGPPSPLLLMRHSGRTAFNVRTSIRCLFMVHQT